MATAPQAPPSFCRFGDALNHYFTVPYHRAAELDPLPAKWCNDAHSFLLPGSFDGWAVPPTLLPSMLHPRNNNRLNQLYMNCEENSSALQTSPGGQGASEQHRAMQAQISSRLICLRRRMQHRSQIRPLAGLPIRRDPLALAG